MLERVRNPAIGYLPCDWLFLDPRGRIDLDTAALDEAHAAPRRARSMDSTND